MDLDRAFWRDRRVFLTGHTGFKGSWLSLWLQRLGARVTGYALPPTTQPNLFELAGVGQGLESRLADIRDGEALAAAMAQTRPQIVIHMAAQALVRQGYQSPVDTYATNVMGTVHLFEAVRRCGGVAAVVNVTSDKCYENREWLWGYRENEPFGGYDPYSSSKGCAELVTAAWRRSYFDPAHHGKHGAAIASARAGNVIGGGDWAADRLIPDIVRAIEDGRSASIRSPGAIRPWQHVLEPLHGYLLLAEKLAIEGPAWGEGWNFGPAEEDARPVGWIADRMVSLWGEGASWQASGEPGPHEAHYLKLDCAKARTRLNWRPRWQLSAALERIVEWHKALRDGGDMNAVCLRQIEAYEHEADGDAKR